MGNTGSCVGRSSGAPKKKGDAPATPHGIPLPPGKPRLVEATQTSLHIKWDKPASDGGAEIFAYIVKMMRDGGSAWKKLDADVEGLEYTAKNLDPGVSYKFYVQCENDNGVSKPSDITELLATKTYEFILAAATNDTNENIKEKVGTSAEKYEVKEDVKDEEDKKSTKSDKSEHSKHSDKSSSSDSSHHSNDEKKESTEETVETKESTQTTHTVKETMNENEHSSQTTVVTETVRTTHIVSAVSNEKDFAVESNDDVGRGKPLSRFAYTYSNDSLLDDDEDTETQQNRFNNDYDVTVHSTTNGMEEYHTIDNEIPQQHRSTFMPPQELIPDQNDYRLSIISERSVEETGSPDPRVSPTKTGSHFTFTKKLVTTNEFEEVDGITEEKRTFEQETMKVTGTEAKSFTMTTNSVTETKPLESRIPMKNSVTSTSSLSSSTSTTTVQTKEMKEVKSQSKLPTFKKQDSFEEKQQERKSSIPERTSIPRSTSSSKVPERKPSFEKSQIPSRSSPGPGEDINRNKSTSSIRGTSPSSKTTGIPSGLPTRRGSGDSPKTQTTQSRIPAMGAKSGIPPPRISTS